MKTLKHIENGKIRRVEDKEAYFLTEGKNPLWGFIPKSEWKSNRKTNPTMVMEETQDPAKNNGAYVRKTKKSRS
jgi:hypothetical protein